MKGEFDAVLTMFHDQGQIAMKLIGFDRGVTLIAGYGFPIVTPAHGTAYDIAGAGRADTGRHLQRGGAGAAAGRARPPPARPTTPASRPCRRRWRGRRTGPKRPENPPR